MVTDAEKVLQTGKNIGPDLVFELSRKAAIWIGGNDIKTEGTFVWTN